MLWCVDRPQLGEGWTDDPTWSKYSENEEGKIKIGYSVGYESKLEAFIKLCLIARLIL